MTGFVVDVSVHSQIIKSPLSVKVRLAQKVTRKPASFCETE